MSDKNSKANIAQKLGQRIRFLRRQRDMTQEQLAESARLSVNYISGIERGKYSPSLVSLQELADALGVEVKTLFDF